MPFSFETVVLIITLIWQAFLTFFLIKLVFHYNNLTKGQNGKSLSSVLENLLSEVKIAKKDIDSLKTNCDRIEKDGIFHIQRFGLLRFNPFKDTGGNQSFILALLDGNDTGFVISSLYSRSGVRWYAKKVSLGKGVDHELSEEEKKAIREAKMNL